MSQESQLLRQAARLFAKGAINRREFGRICARLAVSASAAALLLEQVMHETYAAPIDELPDAIDGADFIIVGAGSAGCVLAHRLSADKNARVLLLEAGPAATLPEIHDPARWTSLLGSSVDWGFSTVPQTYTNDRVHPWPRGRVLGGSSSINTMIHHRGRAADYDRWDVAGWSYADLLPLFKRSETYSRGGNQYRGGEGPLFVAAPDLETMHPLDDACRNAMLSVGETWVDDINDGRQVGTALNQFAIRDNRRQSTGVAFLEPILDRPNLTIVSQAQVASLLFDGKRCRGVSVFSKSGPRSFRATREVILCGGAIGSPQLLLLSGVGPARQLESRGIAVVQDLPGVGQNLHDHLMISSLVYRSRQALGPPPRSPSSEVILYAGANGNSGSPSAFVSMAFWPFVPEGLPRFEGDTFGLNVGLMQPESRGQLTLADADPRSRPIIDPAYLSHPDDRQSVRDVIAIGLEIGSSSAFGDWRSERLLPAEGSLDQDAIGAFSRASTISFSHPVGTCRMGTDSNAVVDETLRVRGVDGLSVADASVIPRIPSAPTNATAIMIGEKAADLTASRHQMTMNRAV